MTVLSHFHLLSPAQQGLELGMGTAEGVFGCLHIRHIWFFSHMFQRLNAEVGLAYALMKSICKDTYVLNQLSRHKKNPHFWILCCLPWNCLISPLPGLGYSTEFIFTKPSTETAEAHEQTGEWIKQVKTLIYQQQDLKRAQQSNSLSLPFPGDVRWCLLSAV